ncbi:MAG: phosphatidylglycerol lysyltransferase domain-containing protein [Elusimicrobiota bacterium]
MELKKIEKKDIPIIKSFLSNFPLTNSAYAISNIYLWNNCIYEVRFGIVDDIMIITEDIINQPNSNRIAFPISKEEISVLFLKEILIKTGYRYVYYVNEKYVKKYENEILKYFNIYLNEGYADYVYDAFQLATLKGSKYSGKRNLIKQFEKNYDGSYKILSLTKNSIEDIISFSKKLDNQIYLEKNFDMLECEKKAISNIESFFDYIDFFGITLYINEEIKGFAIGSILDETTCVLNFEKADKKIKGGYQLIDREFAKIASLKFKYINKEGDLLNPGLRKSKLSYYPTFILNSYILELKL